MHIKLENTKLEKMVKLVPFLPWGGTTPWALRFWVVREIDCGAQDWLARRP